MTKRPYHRDPPEKIAARVPIIKEGLRAGKTASAIAAELGLSPTTISTMIRQTPELHQERRISERGVPRKVGKAGSLYRAVAAQPHAFREWLRVNLPEGSTIADFLVSVAVDVWQEEQFENV